MISSLTARIPSTLTRLAAAITLIISPFHLEAKTAPEIMTARHYEKQVPSEAISTQDTTSAYYVSEKLDGIRAFWNGEKLVTRTGNVISAPAWFIASLPSNTPLDGELWAGRGSFQHIAATVLDQSPNDEQWKTVNI